MEKLPASQITNPNVFIIESLDLEDENKERFEGKYLYNYLKLLGKNPIYYYIRTAEELKLLAPIFRKSEYRYLHISCHGNAEALFTTFDEIKFLDFAETFKKKLDHRRVFISGFNLGDEIFAVALFGKNGGMYSMTAPTKKVGFHQMLPFWSTFYYMMGSVSETSMKGNAIRKALQTCANIFEVDIAHFFKNTQKRSIDYTDIKSKPIFSPDILKSYENKGK